MKYLLYSLLIVQLIGIITQDFKSRAIWWGWIPSLLITCTCIAIRETNGAEFFFFFIMNLGFIALQLTFVTIWFSLKEKKVINILTKYLGIGDVLFFIPLCLLFSPINFIIFYVSTLCLILFIYFLFSITVFKNTESIPLAGSISISLICLIVSNFFLSWNRYYDNNILDCLATHLFFQ